MAATNGKANGSGDSQELVTRLVSALEGIGRGRPEPTPSQAAVIAQHVELKTALAGPKLVRVSPGPTVSKVDPLKGTAGDKVTIEGQHLEATTLVRIGAGEVRDVTRSSTKLELTVPPKATTGPITVFTLLGMAAGGEFTVS